MRPPTWSNAHLISNLRIIVKYKNGILIGGQILQQTAVSSALERNSSPNGSVHESKNRELEVMEKSVNKYEWSKYPFYEHVMT